MQNRRIDLTASQQADIDRLMSQITCDKEFNCVRTKFNALCKAKHVAKEGKNYLVCLEEEGLKCRYYHLIEDIGICGCPLRKTVARIISGIDSVA